MKASEAIAILESLDPNYEVTLYLGQMPKKLPNIPKWDGTPMYPPGYRDSWLPKDPWIPSNTITCGTVQ